MGRDTEMLLDTDRDKSIDLIGEKESVFCRTHIAVGHRIQGGSPDPLRLKYAVAPAYKMTLKARRTYSMYLMYSTYFIQ